MPSVSWPTISAGLSWLQQQQLLSPRQVANLQQTASAQAGAAAAVLGQSLQDRINDALSESFAAGEGYRDWQKRIKAIVAITSHEAEAIGRTYTHRAYHQGYKEIVEKPAIKEEFPYLLWLGTGDSRQRDDGTGRPSAKNHVALNDKVAHRGSPLAKVMEERIADFNCILPGAMIEGTFDLGVRSFYSGQAIEIVLSSGVSLAVTPNHPILTKNGFVPARAIKPGQQVATYNRELNPFVGSGSDQEYHKPTLIENVFETIRLSGFLESTQTSPVHFHGDARFFEGNVEIVGTARNLLDDLKTGSSNKGCDIQFGRGNLALVNKSRDGAFYQFVGSDLSSFSGGMSCADLSRPSFVVHARPLQQFRFGASANLDLGFGKSSSQYRTANACPVGNRFERFASTVGSSDLVQVVDRDSTTATLNASDPQPPPNSDVGDADPIGDSVGVHTRLVQFDCIVELRTFDYSGHVYDLQSPAGIIIANNIVISNCRCSVVYISAEEARERGIDDNTGWVEPSEAETVPEIELPEEPRPFTPEAFVPQPIKPERQVIAESVAQPGRQAISATDRRRMLLSQMDDLEREAAKLETAMFKARGKEAKPATAAFKEIDKKVRQVRDLFKEAREEEDRRIEEARKAGERALALPAERQSRVETTNQRSKLSQQFMGGPVHEAKQWFGEKVVDFNVELKLDVQTFGRRAAYHGKNRIDFNQTELPKTVVHEMGHALEERRGVHEKAWEFVRRRAAGVETVSLKERYPDSGYASDEKVLGDGGRFAETFRLMGYSEEDARKHGDYATRVYNSGHTELVSLGVELMHLNAGKFAAADPEWFEFTLAVMRGEPLP